MEVNLCGHATLASSATLFRVKGQFVFQTIVLAEVMKFSINITYSTTIDITANTAQLQQENMSRKTKHSQEISPGPPPLHCSLPPAGTVTSHINKMAYTYA